MVVSATLFILICRLTACDTVVRPIDNCMMSAFAAQVVLAQTGLVRDGDRVTVRCEARQ
jgi:hypothetical protein